MSTSDASTIATWNSISASMNRYFSICIFLFGTIGNILNVFVLSRRTLRANPCSLFFLISSVANLIAILSGLTTRMLSGWAVDLTNTVDWLCKLRAFVLFVSRNIGAWLILLATIDRWFLSNLDVSRRRLSTLKNAHYGIIITIIFSIIIYSPIFYCYQANLINAPLKCYGKTDLCRLTNDLLYACVTILIPIVLMFIFGLMTIINIHRSKSRIHPNSVIDVIPVGTSSTTGPTKSNSAKKKIDRRLFVMLAVQIILLSLFTLPQAIQKLYSTLTSNFIFSALQTAINNFMFNLALLLTYFANGMAFYIYTLSGGTIFRNALKELIRKILPIR